jgi:hypothetical protein
MVKNEITGTSVTRRSQSDRVHKLVRSRIAEYPYLAVATGAGIAWVLAGGLSARKTTRVLGALGGLALFSPVWSRLIELGATALNPRRN